MKSTQIFALVLGAIALFPSISLAGENISGVEQDASLTSTTLGNGNVTIADTKQSVIDKQRTGYFGSNVSGTSQKVKTDTTTLGDNNLDIKTSVQEAIARQRAK